MVDVEYRYSIVNKKSWKGASSGLLEIIDKRDIGVGLFRNVGIIMKVIPIVFEK